MNNPLATLCDQFLKERHYFKNVTPATLTWYRVAFKNYQATVTADSPSIPTKATLQEFVIRQRDRGVRAVTCNTYIGAMNAFCVWLHQEGHLKEPLKLPKLLAEHRVLVLLTEAQMKTLIALQAEVVGPVAGTSDGAAHPRCGVEDFRGAQPPHRARRFRQSDSQGFGQGPEGEARALLAGAEEAALSVRAVQNQEGHPQRVDVRRLAGESVGKAEQLHVALFVGEEAGTPDVSAGTACDTPLPPTICAKEGTL